MRSEDVDIRNVPSGPGVYLFKDRDGEPIYVGKAKSLRKRVGSYFRNAKRHGAKTRMMLENAFFLDFILTDSELEALILESTLIKKHHPRYNVVLRDDKSYPYIRVSLEEDFPRAFITRRLGVRGSKYFGPYTDVFEIKRTLRYLNQIFGIRTCRDRTFRRVRPCLNYDIKRCSGPCCGKIGRDEYRENVNKLMMFLRGKDRELVKQLEEKMLEHSRKKEYEASKVYRDWIVGIRKLASEQKMVLRKKENMDIVAACRGKDVFVVQVLFVRSGALISKAGYALEHNGESEGEVLNSFLKQYYSRHEIPDAVLLSHDAEDREIISKWLSDESGKRVSVTAPKRGEKYRLTSLALKNARMYLEEYMLKQEKNKEILNSLKDELGLEKIPRRIEAFDISNISGKFAVGSMVVFVDGEPKKSEYRKYKIRSVSDVDDYAMMAEVIERRYSKSDVPDLILIDGGRGHLNAAFHVLEGLNRRDVQIIGLAKEFEDIYLPDKTRPVNLRPESQTLYLLQRVRDEAHRFAVSYHRNLRSKSFTC